MMGGGLYVLFLFGLGLWMSGNKKLMHSMGKLQRDIGRDAFFRRRTPAQNERAYTFAAEVAPRTMRAIAWALLLPGGAFLLIWGLAEAAIAGWQLMNT